MAKPTTDFTLPAKITTDFVTNPAVDSTNYDDSTIEYDAIAIYYDDIEPGESPIGTKLPLDWTPSYGD